MLKHSVAPSTAKAYNRALEFFENFRVNFGFDKIWPAPLQDIVNFIAHMFKSGLSHSTVNTYISGLSFFSRLNNYEDYTNKFIVRKLIDGVKRSRSPQLDTRLPISRELLYRIISVLPSICSSSYESRLFSAAFSLAFHGLFRVGELAVGPDSSVNHTLIISDVKVFQSYLEIYLASSKTDQFGKGITIRIAAQPNKVVCPLVTLSSYLQVRPFVEGPLFCHFNGNPLTKHQFSALLKKSLSTLGIKNARLTSHSFRIGMATTCALEGLSDDQIKTAGRWASSAYLRYIRVPI